MTFNPLRGQQGMQQFCFAYNKINLCLFIAINNICIFASIYSKFIWTSLLAFNIKVYLSKTKLKPVYNQRETAPL